MFRTEFGKIVSVLTRHFGFSQIEVAEDIAGETFLVALDSWSLSGVPANPSAWLYKVAINKARNHWARNNRIQFVKLDDWQELAAPDLDIDLSENNILDSQLRMMFAICQPCISEESQVGLALRILCGFGIDEIANAFLTNVETINKRLHRGKVALRKAGNGLDVYNDHDLGQRLSTVLTTLYLLFNEGYYSETDERVLREDLCHEAMRLTGILLKHPLTNLPQTKALLALMCFHASRFLARRDQAGELVLFDDQDPSLWDQTLISRGAQLLHEASQGDHLSKYHIEASIAYWHTTTHDAQNKWSNVLTLYDHLMQVAPNPVVALNRIYALSRVKGNEVGLRELESLVPTETHYTLALRGQLHFEAHPATAREHFTKALDLARTSADKAFIQRKLDQLRSQDGE